MSRNTNGAPCLEHMHTFTSWLYLWTTKLGTFKQCRVTYCLPCCLRPSVWQSNRARRVTARGAGLTSSYPVCQVSHGTSPHPRGRAFWFCQGPQGRHSPSVVHCILLLTQAPRVPSCVVLFVGSQATPFWSMSLTLCSTRCWASPRNEHTG